jgi:hypothetical protein
LNNKEYVDDKIFYPNETLFFTLIYKKIIDQILDCFLKNICDNNEMYKWEYIV